MISPSRFTVRILFLGFGISLILGLLRIYASDSIPSFALVCLLLVIFALLLIADYILSRGVFYIQAKREVPNILPVGKNCEIKIGLRNTAAYTVKLKIYDHLPKNFINQSSIPELKIKPGEETLTTYQAMPVTRGLALIPGLDIKARSLLNLWQFKIHITIESQAKIYPDFAAIAQLASLEHDQQSAQIGLHILQRRGEGMDFKQLRDFRKGDSLRRVDWKASSRFGKLITRDYQDERDQEVVFLLDCGRRLHSKDGLVSHFDHCLNALLLTSYVALQKGDNVGLMTFAGEQLWVPPRKGNSALTNLIQNTYGLHSNLEHPDFIQLASDTMSKLKRRALVVLISNFQDQDSEDLSAALQILKRKHLVLAASLREHYIDERLSQPVQSFDQALEFSAASDLYNKRKSFLNRLREKNTYVIESTPQELAIQLVNQYKALKASGVF